MYRLFSVLTMCAAILIGGLGTGLTNARIADAKADPEGVFRGLISALNNGDKAAAAALLDDNITFFEPNGDGSFGIARGGPAGGRRSLRHIGFVRRIQQNEDGSLSGSN